MMRFRMAALPPSYRPRRGPAGIVVFLLVLAGVACTQAPTTPTPAATPPSPPAAASPSPKVAVAPSPSPRAAVSPSPSPRVAVSPSPSPSPRVVASPVPSPIALRREVVVTANHDDRSLSVVDAGSARVVTTIGLDRPPHAVALAPLAPDVALAFATDRSEGSRAVVVADLLRPRQIGEVTVGRQPEGIAIPSRGGSAVVTNNGEDSVTTFDPSVRTPAAPIPVGSKPNGVDLVRVGGALEAFVANEGAGSVSVVGVEGRRVLATVPVGGRPTEVVTAVDGSRVFVLDAETGSVVVLNAPMRQVVTTIRVGTNLTDLETSLDGRFLFVTADDASRNLYQIDLTTNQVIQDFNVGAGALAIAAGSEPGRLYVTTVDNRLLFWDIAARRATTTLSVGRRPEGVAVATVGIAPSPSPSPAVPRVQPSPSPAVERSPSPPARAPAVTPAGAAQTPPAVPATPAAPAASLAVSPAASPAAGTPRP